MKASRAQMKVVKSVAETEERVTSVEARLTKIEMVLQRLVSVVSTDKSSGQGQEVPTKAPRKVQTVQKGGGA